MAGHSKWANIKHRKERADKKKGKLFSRIMKEIISAVKQGGPDPKANTKLKIAVQKAKDANIPSDNVERNIKKAVSANALDYFSLTYEIYGIGGVGLIVDILTDNKNRIASDVRIALNKCGGTLASPGSVAYNFERKGVFRIAKEGMEEEALFLLATEAGAEDFQTGEDVYTIISAPEMFGEVKEALEAKALPIEEAELAMVPKVYVEVDESTANANIQLIEWLENLDDVDAVHHNMQI